MSGMAQAASIETATLAHARIMAEIHQMAFPRAEAWSGDVVATLLEAPLTFGFIHASGGMILSRVAADEAEILTLAVAPARRRLGIGSGLLRAAMERATLLGAESTFLEVAVTNQAALALYKAHGFAEAGLRRRYYSDGTDALILRSTSPPDRADS